MKRALRPSIWLKLAIFVSVLVMLTSGMLIWTAYLFARDMLLDQIHARLTVTASDRQAMLLAYIRQQEERVRLVASRTRLRQGCRKNKATFHAVPPARLRPPPATLRPLVPTPGGGPPAPRCPPGAGLARAGPEAPTPAAGQPCREPAGHRPAPQGPARTAAG